MEYYNARIREKKRKQSSLLEKIETKEEKKLDSVYRMWADIYHELIFKEKAPNKMDM